MPAVTPVSEDQDATYGLLHAVVLRILAQSTALLQNGATQFDKYPHLGACKQLK